VIIGLQLRSGNYRCGFSDISDDGFLASTQLIDGRVRLLRDSGDLWNKFSVSNDELNE